MSEQERAPNLATPAGMRAELDALAKEQLTPSDRIALIATLLEARDLEPRQVNLWPQVGVVTFAAALALLAWTVREPTARIDVVVQGSQFEVGAEELQTLSFESPFVSLTGWLTAQKEPIDIRTPATPTHNVALEPENGTVYVGALSSKMPGRLGLQVHATDDLAEISWRTNKPATHEMQVTVGEELVTFKHPNHSLVVRAPKEPLTIGRMIPIRDVTARATHFSENGEHSYSSITSGRVRLLDSGREHTFEGGEVLDFDSLDADLIAVTILPDAIRLQFRGTASWISADEVDLRPTIYEVLTHRYKVSAVWATFTAIATLLLALTQWWKTGK